MILPRRAFLASLAASAVIPRLAQAQELTPLRATSAIDDAATPFLYAMDTGLFRKNGFEASLERATTVRPQRRPWSAVRSKSASRASFRC